MNLGSAESGVSNSSSALFGVRTSGLICLATEFLRSRTTRRRAGSPSEDTPFPTPWLIIWYCFGRWRTILHAASSAAASGVTQAPSRSIRCNAIPVSIRMYSVSGSGTCFLPSCVVIHSNPSYNTGQITSPICNCSIPIAVVIIAITPSKSLLEKRSSSGSTCSTVAFAFSQIPYARANSRSASAGRANSWIRSCILWSISCLAASEQDSFRSPTTSFLAAFPSGIKSSNASVSIRALSPS